ncbi:hypothetical protein HHL21_04765 [Massilia sp. RP-1-19]|uniref:Uncharacterized protein n=1 Tax=Massilia polaris TaxID=2728846 RepID=A0A848HJN6_9BURK|nr:hypothetical protein [Massilia polaris]NML60410.1 hypothetical protein [Massilia polaris]
MLLHLPGLPWECLSRDDAASWLPTLHALIESGSAGPLAPVGRHPLMDGVVLTGRGPADSGLLAAMAPRPDRFGADLAGALHLKVPGFARYLDDAGKRCALVNLRGTHFDELARGIIASDGFFEVRAHSYAQWGIPPGALAPLSMAGLLADLRVHPEDLAPSQLGPLVAGESGSVRPEQLRMLARALAETSGAHTVATYLAEHGALDMCAVRYPVLAGLGGMFGDPAQRETGKGTAWALIALLDAFVARMLALGGNDAVIMITGGNETRPFWIASGPGVAVDELWPEGTSLYDVAPSMLSMFGLADPSMPGQSRIIGGNGDPVAVAPVALPGQVLSLPDSFAGPAA